MRVKTIAAIGAYLQSNMPAFLFNAGTLAGTYRTPAIFADITAVFTNTNPVRPYRGNGRPEAGFVIERMVDLAAAELAIDPAELRRRNYIAPDQMPFQKTGVLPWPYIEGLRLDEAMNPLALFATGIYGKPLPNQNGAPIRLVTPWKYGFKGVKDRKSVV